VLLAAWLGAKSGRERAKGDIAELMAVMGQG
jgi:hypothetical protein